MNHLAVIEIGSNAVRMILGEKGDDSTLKIVCSWSSHLRLGEEVFQKGIISETFQFQLCRILEQLLKHLESFSACSLQLFGSSALRDAKNREQVLKFLEKTCGVSVYVLSGQEEASVLLDGLNAFLPKPYSRQVVADLGGGSLELSLRNKDLLFRQCSLNVGTLRLREIEPNRLESSELFQKTIMHLEQEAGRFLEVSSSESDLLLTGGNAKTLGRFYMQINNSTLNSSEGGVSMNWKVFEDLIDRFINLSPEMLQDSWDLRVHQSEVFHSALKLFLQIGEIFKARQVMIPFMGLKEALLLKLCLDQDDPETDQRKTHLKLVFPKDLHPTEVPFN